MEEEKKEQDSTTIQEARKSLLAVLQRLEIKFKPKFSSTPIEESPSDEAAAADDGKAFSSQSSLLTEPERDYLESLLRTGDRNSIIAASLRLRDSSLFPESPTDEEEEEVDQQNQDKTAAAKPLGSKATNEKLCSITEPPTNSTAGDDSNTAAATTCTHEDYNPKSSVTHRDSKVQQELFRLHEKNCSLSPSHMLQRIALCHRNSILVESQNSMLYSFDESIDLVTPQRNSNKNDTDGAVAVLQTSGVAASLVDEGGQFFKDDGEEEDKIDQQQQQQDNQKKNYDEVEKETNDSDVPDAIRSLKDLSNWLDGNEGVEVNDSGMPMSPQSWSSLPSRQHFRILGTAGNDISCHPHVLTPPLMESLLAFVPESLTDSNFWLKYSLVRDGSNLWTLLRNARASACSFIAIETTDGHVLGAFTSQAWRLSQGWYGSKESFLWKMRKSRLQTSQSILRQACQESEIQVYPYRTGNVAVQYCSKKCLMMGQGELLPVSSAAGKHYGHALYLESSLKHGTTSTSETFGNPCLVRTEQRGARFEVANIEVWTLTSHDTVAAAEQSELSTLFLQGGREAHAKNLNFMNILVGGPI